MINDFEYGVVTVTEKDGVKTPQVVPPNIGLLNFGPLIPVIITHPQSVAAQMQKEGKKIPAKTVTALIDTGAFGSVIIPELAAELGLLQTGFRKVTSVQNEEDQPAFFARLQFQWGKGKDVSVVSCPLKTGPFQVLIGRDIMQHWNLIYNGAKGTVTVCD